MRKTRPEFWLPVIVWLFVIFLFSTDTFSAGNTSRFILPLLKYLFPGSGAEWLEFLHNSIRKAGHMTEYFILAVLTHRSIKEVWREDLQVAFRTLTFIAFAASLDEVHQAMTQFRGASPIDVGYDCLGAILALSVLAAYETRRLPTHPVL